MTRDAAPYDLVISIINYRTAALTIACVTSVIEDLRGTPDIHAHVVVVDNASGDGSDTVIADWIADQGPGAPVTLIRSSENTGFSGGHNQSMNAFHADFYLVLNSDAVLKLGFCAAMLEVGRADPEAGLFTPRIEYENGSQQPSCFRMHSPLSELIRAAATGPVTKLFHRYVVAPLDMPPDLEQVGWVSFAGILLRAQMIENIGLMDEGYFLYFEDTEYCLRACRAGWRISYVPQARFIHFVGGSTALKDLATAKKRLPKYYYASRTRLLYQAHGYMGFLMANLLWYCGRGLAQLRPLLGKPVPPAMAHEWRDIWTNALTPLGDRRQPKDS
ncbi:glycosyltransferase family 2 protein [Roseobacter litoralis]|uniref:glycosyltransferase family 2 protein n=1 Tax=Roseobacter litoralis TaxID=42443 RepID=UPI00249544DA|nr:glycosyltransferase family 2 protein [Roseobacter litoralis]